MDTNYKLQTLEQLENITRNPAQLSSKINDLRKIILDKFSVEDLRYMISRGQSHEFLIPYAIEILREDLFAEGDPEEDDLLQTVLNIDMEFWKHNRGLWQELGDLIKNKKE